MNDHLNRLPLLRASLLLTMSLGAVIAAPAVVLEFDEFPSGTVITNQYPEAVFSSSAGHENYAIAFAGTATPPNMLCSGAAGVPDRLQDTYIDFTTPLFHMDMIAIIQNSNTGTIAQFNVFEHGIHTRTQFLTGPGHPDRLIVDFQQVDFMTRLEIVGIAAPIGWDNMGLDPVPEPSSIASIVGLATLVAVRRRRRS